MKLKNIKTKVKLVSIHELKRLLDLDSELISPEGFYDVHDDVIYLIKEDVKKDTFIHELAHAIFTKYYLNTSIYLLKSDDLIVALNEMIADFATQFYFTIEENQKLFKSLNKKRKNKGGSKKPTPSLSHKDK